MFPDKGLEELGWMQGNGPGVQQEQLCGSGLGEQQQVQQWSGSRMSLYNNSVEKHKYLSMFYYYLYKCVNPSVALSFNNGSNSVSNYMCVSKYHSFGSKINLTIKNMTKRQLTLPDYSFCNNIQSKHNFKCAPQSFLFYGKCSHKEVNSTSLYPIKYFSAMSTNMNSHNLKAKANNNTYSCSAYLGKIQSELPMVALDVSQYRQYTDQELFAEYCMIMGGYMPKDALELICQWTGAAPTVDSTLPNCKSTFSGAEVKNMLKYLNITESSKIDDVLKRLSEYHWMTQNDFSAFTEPNDYESYIDFII